MAQNKGKNIGAGHMETEKECERASKKMETEVGTAKDEMSHSYIWCVCAQRLEM